MGLCGSCSAGRVPSETPRVCHTRQGRGTACAHLGERALRGSGAGANRHAMHAKPGGWLRGAVCAARARWEAGACDPCTPIARAGRRTHSWVGPCPTPPTCSRPPGA